MPRAYVAGTLWPDVDDDRAGANLRSTVWRARRACPVISANGDAVGVAPGTAIDVIDLVDTARRLGDGIELPATATAGFADELLPGWYDDWVLVWRERWRQIRLHALEALAARYTAAGDFPRAVETGMQAVRTEPLRESAHRVVIAAHLAEGNAVEAIRQYRWCRQVLAEDLGAAPSPILENLIRPWLSPVDAPVTGG